jgi:cell wall-associated NlpC family hydrolase
VLAGFVVPLALIGSSRSAHAGPAAPALGPVVEHDGGVAAPALLTSLVAGQAPAGVRTPAIARTARLTGDPSTLTPGSIPARLGLAIVAANRIATFPYIWGGGHGSFDAAGYDCSGSVSYVLHAALALDSPEDSGGLESFGDPGPGQWITVYANAAHAFMTLGGLRYDTSGLSATGSRWHSLEQIPAGYVERHPVGL